METPRDLDVDGHTNLDNVSIAGVTTTSGNIIIENAEPSIFFTDTDNGNPDYKIFNDAGALKIYDTTYSATRLQIGQLNGEVTIASNTNFTNGITMHLMVMYLLLIHVWSKDLDKIKDKIP